MYEVSLAGLFGMFVLAFLGGMAFCFLLMFDFDDFDPNE